MIKRRSVLLIGSIGMLVAHRLVRARGASTIPRVGILLLQTPAAIAHLRAAFVEGMHDLGWLDGKNIEFRFAYADGDVDRLGALVNELVVQQVAVIVVSSPVVTRAAQRATKTIPIVMASGSNAVGNGFITSLAKPGGNITGITTQNEIALGKVIEVLHQVVPGARRVAVLLNESSPSHPVLWAATQSACAAFDLVALRVVASTPAQLGAAVEEIVRQRSQAVVVVADPMYLSERERLRELMQTIRLPVAYALRDHVVVGGLLSYSYDITASFRYAAKYVDKILKGAKPADLPVEQPTKFELVINLKTAKGLGLTIPQSLLLRADEVIQ
jgi:putative ABC transport system substrate-binding protein